VAADLIVSAHPSRLTAWAEQTGPATGRVAADILAGRPHREQGYRACLGLMRLGRLHGAARLEAACLRAERLRSYRYRTVEHILSNQQDRLPLDDAAPARPAVAHENVLRRGLLRRTGGGDAC
jgi:hypothetical protein